MLLTKYALTSLRSQTFSKRDSLNVRTLKLRTSQQKFNEGIMCICDNANKVYVHKRGKVSLVKPSGRSFCLVAQTLGIQPAIFLADFPRPCCPFA